MAVLKFILIAFILSNWMLRKNRNDTIGASCQSYTPCGRTYCSVVEQTKDNTIFISCIINNLYLLLRNVELHEIELSDQYVEQWIKFCEWKGSVPLLKGYLNTFLEN